MATRIAPNLPLSVLPPNTLFVMVQPLFERADGKGYEATYHAFTADGIRSRTMRSVAGGWDWLRNYETKEPMPWTPARNGYTEHVPPTVEGAKVWHEREHDWATV